MSDIRIKLNTNDLKTTAKAAVLPTGYIKPEGTLKINKVGKYDVTRYANVIFNLGKPVYMVDEQGTTSLLRVIDENGNKRQVYFEEVI